MMNDNTDLEFKTILDDFNATFLFGKNCKHIKNFSEKNVCV